MTSLLLALGVFVSFVSPSFCQKIYAHKIKYDEHPVFNLRAIFKNELRVCEALEKVVMTRQIDLKGFKNEQLKKDIKRYIALHDDVRGVLAKGGIGEYDDFDKKGTEADNFIDVALAGNPIHNFRLLRRCVLFDSILETIRKNDEEEELTALLEKLHELRNQTRWPTLANVKKSASNLARIQDVYRLEFPDVLEGKLLGVATGAALSVDDCVFVAKTRMRADPLLHEPKFWPEVQIDHEALGIVDHEGPPEHAKAIEWLEACTAYATRKGDTRLMKTILNLLLKTRKQHDDNFVAPSDDNEYPNATFFHRRLGNDLATTGRWLRQEEDKLMASGKLPEGQEDFPEYFGSKRFNSLCREDTGEGRYLIPKPCYFDSTNNPYIKLQPIKVELYGKDPKHMAKVYHNLFSDRDTDIIQKKGFLVDWPEMWVEEFEERDPALASIGKRLEAISGLDVVWGDTFDGRAESYQLKAFVAGQKQVLESDAYGRMMTRQRLKKLPSVLKQGQTLFVGDRMAVFLINLSSSAGGRLVFPLAGFSLPTSERGSAAFWFTLDRDGRVVHDMNIRGGCTTAVGTQWVALKRIRHVGQFLTRPCSTKQKAS